MQKEYVMYVKKAMKNDEDAFQYLYRQFYPMVYQYSLKLVNYNGQDAQEICQETFINAWKYIKALKKPDYFPLWLKRIAHSRSIRMFEKKRVVYVDEQTISQEDLEDHNVVYNPHKLSNNQTDEQIVRNLVRKLSYNYQEILELYYFQQMTIKEIQKHLNVSEGTVKSRMYHARLRLKEIVEEFEQQEQRKLNFHIDAIAPPCLLLGIYTIQEGLKKYKKQVLIASQTVAVTAMVASGALIGKEVISKNINEELKQLNPVKQEVQRFDEVIFKNQKITNPMEAYYAILMEVSQEDDFKTLSLQDFDALNNMINSLQNSDAKYWNSLNELGWIQTFYNYQK